MLRSSMKTIVHQCLPSRRRMRKCHLGVVSVSCPAQEMHVGPSRARAGESQRQLRWRSKFANDSACLCSLGNGIFCAASLSKKECLRHHCGCRGSRRSRERNKDHEITSTYSSDPYDRRESIFRMTECAATLKTLGKSIAHIVQGTWADPLLLSCSRTTSGSA